MSNDLCHFGVCFFKLSASAPKFFGFSEFLAALALMVLVWTVAEPRYRFRIQTAPLPLQGLTFIVVTTVGVLTLLTDVWRSEEWYVARGSVLTPATWQGFLGALFLVTFLVWAWFAFMRPAVFSRFNAKRFEEAVARTVLRGVGSELAVVADELGRSVRELVRLAPDEIDIRRHKDGSQKLTPVSISAHQIFLLLGDPRHVKALVASAPRTALLLFREMASIRRYPPALHVFASNFVQESIQNKESYLYHEAEGYDTGLMGYEKPLTRAMFGKYELVNSLDRMLDLHYRAPRRWDADQLEAYTRLTLLTLEAYVKDGHIGGHSFVLHRAMDIITGTQSALPNLNGRERLEWEEGAYEQLRVCVEFIQKAVEILDSMPIQQGTAIRIKEKPVYKDIYRQIADAACELIYWASAVRGPRWTCWSIQHNTVWSELFFGRRLGGPVGSLVKHAIRRQIFDEIKHMERSPNYKGANLLGFSLNVLGHKIGTGNYGRDGRALQKAVLEWLRQHYHALHESRPDIAAHCLVDSMTYDAGLRRIMVAWPGRLGTNKTRYTYIQVN